MRHGTNPYNNLSIRINGGDPSHGGKSTGGTSKDHGDKPNVKNYFYLFKDSELLTNIEWTLAAMVKVWTVKSFFIPFFKGLSGGWARIKKENGTASNILLAISGLASCLISSTLHFRFASIDQNRLKNDPAWRLLAYRTKHKVES